MTSQPLEPPKPRKRPKNKIATGKPTAALALRALEQAIYHASQASRWRLITENTPTGSGMNRRAHDEWQKASLRAYNGFMLVRRALGYDPDADEPQPQRHWDAGA